MFRLNIVTKDMHRHLGSKHYLYQLPELPEPLERYDEYSQDLIMLYPIFRGVSHEPWDIELLFRIPAAIWSKRSFMLNSDVVEKGVPIKFYMEDGIWNDVGVQSYMKRQGVTEDDVITFDGSEMEVDLPINSELMYMGKQLYP